MNNQTPLVPQGSLDHKASGRARVKIGVFFVLSVHAVGLMALLLYAGCNQRPTGEASAQVDGLAASEQTPDTEAATALTNTPSLQPVASATQLGTAATSTGILATPPTMPARPPGVGLAESMTPAAAPANSDYTVQSGDIPANIAKHFGIRVKALMDANPGVDAKKLQIGQKLHIPAATPSSPAAAPTSGAMVSSVAPATPGDVYKVKSGDVLTTIAKAHHTTVRQLRVANPGIDPNRLRVGQELKLPAATAPAAPAASTASGDSGASAHPAVPTSTPLPPVTTDVMAGATVLPAR